MSSAEKYKPKERGKSDFYSWNLYRWLRKQDKEGDLKKTNIYKTEGGSLYIGARYYDHLDHVVGVNLRSLCSGSGYGRFPLCGSFMGSDQWQDITDWFWSEYDRIGVCAIHGDFSHDWKYTEAKTFRVCTNCKKREFKKVEMVERVTWEGK